MGWFSLRNVAAVGLAPFTGGASLLAMNNKDGKSIIGDFTGANSAKKANSQNLYWSNYWNNKQVELSNTAHQREMADLKAAGLNPVLAANAGASVPNVQSTQMQQELPGGLMGSAVQGASILQGLAQAKNLTVNSALQTAQTTLDTAIKNDLRPTTIKMAKQNLNNAIEQQKLIQNQTTHSAKQAENTEMDTKLKRKQKEKMVTRKGGNINLFGLPIGLNIEN